MLIAMDDLATRLRSALKDAGFSQERASVAAGQNKGFIKDILVRNRRPSVDAAASLARVLGVSLDWLMGAESESGTKVRLVGRVGAGGVVSASDPSDVEYVDMPPGGTPDLEALEVVNGSMQPVYRAGDYLFVSPADDGTPFDKLIGLECVVVCADGRRLVKVLRKGTRLGLWRLESYNPAVEDIEDVRVVKALPVRHVTRKLGV